MSYVIGIDLGSTTTKAIILDQQQNIVGKGITNSRSNYDIACEVAKTEALIDARFYLLKDILLKDQQFAEKAKQFLPYLEQSFKCQQYLRQLEILHEIALTFSSKNSALQQKATCIFNQMNKNAEELFQIHSKKRSDFFRDTASSQYLSLAESIADPKNVSYDDLVVLFDKSIIQAEGLTRGLDFESNIEPAISHALKVFEQQQQTASEFTHLIKKAINIPISLEMIVGTGYGRARLPFPKEQIRSEILCHGLGAHFMYANTRTVLDIGGQDTKAIQVDENGIVTSFQMNDRCAAGCGRYLGYIADELNIGLHELGPLAMQSKRLIKINSTCTVFAGAELRERLSRGEKREDILSGLHRAIILRALSLLAKSGGVVSEFTFTGGVANNASAVKALHDLILENYGDITMNIDPNSIYTGALGAALFAHRQLYTS